MSLNKRVALIFDTNFLYIDEEKPSKPNEINFETYFKFNKTFEFLRLNEKIDIFIPELVLCEKISHQKQKFKNEIIEDISTYSAKLKSRYFNELNIIPLPFNKHHLFNDIFRMALNMQPPFSSNEEYDKGFKDSALLLSLFEYAKFNQYDEYTLLTKDTGFTNNISSIQKYMKSYCSSFREINEESFVIIKNEDFYKFFYDKYEIFINLRKYLDEEFLEYIDYNYGSASYIFAEYDCPIKDYDILYDQTRIYQLDENLYEVEIFISITPNYNDDSNPYIYDEKISQWEIYYFEKTDGGWKYSLEDYRYNIDYEPFIWNESFLDDEYP